jgi:hypothetical protein
VLPGTGDGADGLMTWEMHAHKYESGQLWNLGPRWWVEVHGLSDPIVAVTVEETPESEAPTHWGWLKTGKDTPEMIYPRRFLLEMCFPYGIAAEVEAGRGREMRLTVREATE